MLISSVISPIKNHQKNVIKSITTDIAKQVNDETHKNHLYPYKYINQNLRIDSNFFNNIHENKISPQDSLRFNPLQRSIYLLATKNYKTALKILKQIPNKTEIHFMLITKALSNCGFHKETIKYALDNLSNCQNTEILLKLHFFIGYSYNKLQNFEQAEKHYKKSLSIRPESITFFNLGDLYLKQYGKSFKRKYYQKSKKYFKCVNQQELIKTLSKIQTW